jgi:D-alanine-D-alanine ligase
VSLNSGNQVFDALDKQKYEILRYDPKTDLQQLVMDASRIDAALIILHGPFGEDGTVQGLLDLLDIPYQGAGVLGSAVAMNKLLSKRLYEAADIPTPAFRSIMANDDIDISGLVQEIGLPLVVKPACAGSSVGMTIVKEAGGMKQALEDGFAHDDTLIVEAYVKGIELTCGVLGNENPEPLPVIEIIPGEGHDYFDFNAKYVAGETEEICPARIDEQTTQKVQNLAVRAHQALFLKGYSRTDLILEGNDLFVLETNTIPGMTATSLYPQSAAAAGYSFSRLLDTLIQLAIEEHENKTKRRDQ